MSGSTFGKLFTISTWGESHGKALGVVIDGCPAGISLEEADIQADLDRRKPGSHLYSTPRKESDTVHILSGVFQGKTTGTPISLVIYNEDHHSADYSALSEVYRPGHADFTFDQKFGFRDYRGGGRSSGRETAARVAAGAVAKKILASLDISICAYTKQIGPVSIEHFDANEILKNKVCMPDANAAQKASAFLDDCIKKQDSAGGIIECRVEGLPAGIGEPVFQKLDALLGQAILSIGAVKGIEFGDGFDIANAVGSQNNDSFYVAEDGSIQKRTNHAGGILGGISDGSPLIFRAALKPTPSIGQEQQTVNAHGEATAISIKGRHDPVVVPRAVVVVEAMTAITLVDLLFQNMLSTIHGIHEFYKKNK
ncbi:MAG: chorismate synthase [Epulopiscium sp.]|nr:chorismate synthase [Candidatus Epulonipiscium sp.]